jgi:farnesyl diphosphate synthase
MDDDALRRGRPTCHIEFGEAMAILAGDALQALAFEVLAADPQLADAPRIHVEMLRVLAAACGAQGMAGGQALDLAAIGQHLAPAELERMHVHKTGALIRASVALGARCSSALAPGQLARLDHYAKCVGLAFQVVDDVLDKESSTATLGKTVGKDAANNKPTYVSALGLARAKALAEELREEAQAALSELRGGARRLAELADFIVLRKF